MSPITVLGSVTPAPVRDRVELLIRLKWVGPGLLAALVGLTVLGSAVPAATAVTVGWLIDRLTDADSNTFLPAAAPLSAYALVLLTGHVVTAVRRPLSYLAQARIDGRHRAELSGLAASSPTIDPLERSEVQALIRTARADPESFMDGTPGAGVLAQLSLIGRSLALVGSGLVLAAYAWWSAPLLVVAAVVIHQLRWHEGGSGGGCGGGCPCRACVLTCGPTLWCRPPRARISASSVSGSGPSAASIDTCGPASIRSGRWVGGYSRRRGSS